MRTIRSSFWAGIRIYPSIPLTGACKAHRIKAFLSLLSAGSPSFPVTGCFLPAVNDGGTGLTVFRPVGAGKKGLAADSALFVFLPIKQGSRQGFIQGQNSGAEPVAQQRVGNALHANSSSQAPYHSLSYSKAKLIHYAARPLPTKSSDFAGTP